MAIADEIRQTAKTIFATEWIVRKGSVVPEPRNVRLGNDAIDFERATVLYADLDQSTSLVESNNWYFSAEIYKSFLYAASRMINAEGGTIVSYDGDRVMGIFLGGEQCNTAVSCAFKINYAVRKLVQGELNAKYNTNYTVRQVVGVDTSQIRAVRTGVRGDNDLVWVGNAANIAAKLTALPSHNGSTWITKAVYDLLKKPQKLGPNNENMWKKWRWDKHNDDEIWSSTYWQPI